MAQAQKSAVLYTQGYGGAPSASLQTAVVQTRDPASGDIMGSVGPYPIGQRWVNSSSNRTFTLSSVAPVAGSLAGTWIQEGGGTGVTAAMSGSPGAVTVTSSAVTTSSIILFSRATTGGTPGQVSITAQSAGSFTLTSTGNESSTFNYLIIN